MNPRQQVIDEIAGHLDKVPLTARQKETVKAAFRWAIRQMNEAVVEAPAEPVWQWYYGQSDEAYTGGPCADRQEAVESGEHEFDGEPFFIIEAAKGSMMKFLPSAERIIDDTLERADDDDAFGDNYAERARDATAAEADLDALLKGWFERHKAIWPTPWAFAATRNSEEITPAAADAAA
jgi:hypothetical protein